MQKQDSSAGGRDVFEQREKGAIGWPAQVGIGSQDSGWRFVEGLPAVVAFEVCDSDPRRDTKRPGLEDSGLAQEPELAENLDRSLLQNVIGEIGPRQARDVAPQRRVAVAEKLFQGSPVAGLGEQHQKRLVGLEWLLRMRWGVHA